MLKYTRKSSKSRKSMNKRNINVTRCKEKNNPLVPENSIPFTHLLYFTAFYFLLQQVFYCQSLTVIDFFFLFNRDF